MSNNLKRGLSADIQYVQFANKEITKPHTFYYAEWYLYTYREFHTIAIQERMKKDKNKRMCIIFY